MPLPPSLSHSYHLYTMHAQSHRSHSDLLVECVKAISLCHNVTPVLETEEGGGADSLPGEGEGEDVNISDSDDEATVIFRRGAEKKSRPTVSYQASSPDEVSLSYLYMTKHTLNFSRMPNVA